MRVLLIEDEATIAKLKSVQTNDEYFAEAIKKSGIVVLGSTFGESTETASAEIRVPSSFSIRNADPAPFVENHDYVLRPIPVLEAAAAGRGIFSVSENRLDGIVHGPEGSVDKLLMTWTEQTVGAAALAVAGDDTALKTYLYSRAQSVMGGTSQIQRNLIATRILGLPTS